WEPQSLTAVTDRSSPAATSCAGLFEAPTRSRSARCRCCDAAPIGNRRSLLLGRHPDLVEGLLQPVVGVIRVVDVHAHTPGGGIGQAKRALTFDVGIVAQAERALAFDIGVGTQAERALAFDIGVGTQAERALAFHVGVGAQAERALALDVGV